MIVFITIFTEQHIVAETSDEFIKTTKRTMIYDEIAGERIKVGSLEKGQTIKVEGESGNYYQIRFSHGLGQVLKRDTVIVENSGFTGKLLEEKHDQNQMIITRDHVTVYDNVSGTLVPFAKINPNMRYAVVRSYGENWWEITIGGRIGYIYKPATEMDTGVPVLMYHHILKDNENKNYRDISTTISLDFFNENMKYLADHEYKVITLQELEGYLLRKENLTGKVVAITFDDGLKTNYLYAYPILKKYGFKVAEFTITNRTRKDPTPFNPETLQFISITEIDEMNESQIFSFQAHSHGLHSRDVNYSPLMIMKSYQEIMHDLQTNQEMLTPYGEVNYFAYPFGQYDEEALQALKDSGFRMAFTTKPGKVQIGDSLLELKRQGIGPEHDLQDFDRKISN